MEASLIESSNLSNEEYYKLNGTLSRERLEGLLDESETLINLFSDIDSKLESFRTAKRAPPKDEMINQIDDILFRYSEASKLISTKYFKQ